MSNKYQPFLLSPEEMDWIDKQTEKFETLRTNKELTHLEVKESFDEFYYGVVELYYQYPSKMLKNFYIIGYDYNGIAPGNRPNFLSLYGELINLVKDKVMDKPIKYFIEQDSRLVSVLEYEDGTIEFLE